MLIYAECLTIFIDYLWSNFANFATQIHQRKPARLNASCACRCVVYIFSIDFSFPSGMINYSRKTTFLRLLRALSRWRSRYIASRISVRDNGSAKNTSFRAVIYSVGEESRVGWSECILEKGTRTTAARRKARRTIALEKLMFDKTSTHKGKRPFRADAGQRSSCILILVLPSFSALISSVD